ncbi:MAG: o-succinylbenzoate synthase, partial [Chlorobi bacterium]|nr:o-succinylbenzoate synthase [Chlorobiota bacterium]
MCKKNLRASYKKHELQFKRPAGTSRGVLTSKISWFIVVRDEENPNVHGIGEAGILPGLSIDDPNEIEDKIIEVCQNINNFRFYLVKGLIDFPAIHFGLETALIDLEKNGKRVLFPSGFTKGTNSIEINGLVWMGKFDFMRKQIVEKIESGFSCIKLKIG